MSSRYTLLANRIQAKLQAIEKLQEVLTGPGIEFSGYPAAYFVPDEGESSWATENQDERVYAFVVLLYVEAAKATAGQALNALFDLVDDVLDSFAQDRQMTSGATTLQADLVSNGYTSDVVAGVHPVAAGWEEIPERKLLRARINLKVSLLTTSQ